MRQENRDFLAQLKFSTKLTLIILVGGVTLAINPQGYNLFVLPKAYLLLNLSLVAIGAAILHIILGGSFRFPPITVTLAALSFLVVSGLATINSVLPRLSFFGKMPRYEGFLTLVLYTALFFLAANYFDSKEDRKHLYWAIAGITVVVSVYAVFQGFGFDFIKWDLGLASSRARSFTGNAATLGAFMALTLPFIASPLLLVSSVANSEKAKVFVWAILILGVSAAVLTRSRGAWLALLAAGLFILFRRLQGRRKAQTLSWKKITLSLVLAVGLLISVVYSFLYIEFERGTASGRLVLWERTIKGIEAKPVLGWGPETFQYTFPEHTNQQFEDQVTRKTII
ncbi:MAG: O-antigen ligase family protein, partial [Actinomycetia bacterium]|nr:O-antigen ligase family protein [Actinomycetes bacterium]